MRFIRYLPVLLLVTGFLCSCSPSKREPVTLAEDVNEYRLVLATAVKPYTMTTNHNVVVLVNGNPVGLLSAMTDSMMMPLNLWIHKGANSVYLTGTSEREFEMYVTQYPFEALCGSAEVLLKDDVKSEPLMFEVTDDIKSPLDNATTFADKKSLSDDARDFLREINTLIKNHDYKKFVSQSKDKDVFLTTLYDVDYSDIVSEAESYWEEHIKDLPLIDIEALKYVIGESAILIYHESDCAPPSFDDDAPTPVMVNNKLTPVVMVKINDTWMLW